MKSLSKFLSQYGIRHQISCTYTPQQNVWAERKNRQLFEEVLASMFGMNMPQFYWGEAVKSSFHLINLTPSRIINFQKLHSLLRIPYLLKIESRVFGCSTVYVHIHQTLRNILDPCAKKCALLATLILKKDIGFMTLKPKNYMWPWILPFMKQSLIIEGEESLRKRICYIRVVKEMSLQS